VDDDVEGEDLRVADEEAGVDDDDGDGDGEEDELELEKRRVGNQRMSMVAIIYKASLWARDRHCYE